jgi:hypothetical protein
MKGGFWREAKNVLLATLIAGLVWVWAEGESVASRTLTLAVELPSDASADLHMRPDDPAWKGSARIRLEGSTRNIEAASQILGSKIALRAGLEGMPTAEGERGVVDLRLALSSLPEVRQLGSPIAEVEPRTVVVRVTRVVSREVPLRAGFAREVPLDGAAEVVPPTVTLRLPANIAETMPQGEQAEAWVSEEELGRLRGQGRETVKAVIRPPASVLAAEPLFVLPEAASVTLRVRTRVESINYSSLAVWFALPPTEDAGAWVVTLVDKTISDVTLTGPSDEIARLRTGETTVTAVVQLAREDLEAGIGSKDVTFLGVPASVSVSTPTREVRVKIQRSGS